MKKLSIGILSALVASSTLTGCGGGSSSVMPHTAGPAISPTQQPTSAPGQQAPQQRTTATLKITVPKATTTSSAARRSMYVSPNTASIRIAATQVDGKAPNVPDTIVALNTKTAGCATDATTQALICTMNIAAPVGNSVTFQISTYASSDGTGAVLSAGIVTNKIVANAANPIAIALGGLVASIKFSPDNISVYADGSGHRYLITVNALDASGATIIGTSRYQSPIALSVQNDPHGALGLSNVSLQGPGSTFYLTYNSAVTLDGATIIASDGTDASGTPVRAQMFLDPLSYRETQPNHSYGITTGGTPYQFVLHENNFTGTYTYALSDPDVESVSIGAPNANGDATVTLTPSSVNSGFSTLTVSDGTVQMPIGTQVLPSANPTIKITNLPFSGLHHNQPYRLLSGPAGSNDLWFAGSEDGIIGKLNIGTSPVSETIYPISSPVTPVPQWMVWGPDGKIWYANGNPSVPSIDSFDPVTGQTVAQYTNGVTFPSFPFGMIVGPDGKFWYSDRGVGVPGIGAFDANNPTAGATKYTGGLDTAGQDNPGELTFGPDGNLWFANTACCTATVGSIGMLDMSTHVISRYATGLPAGITDNEDGPAGIASDGQKLWFVGMGTNAYVGSIDPTTKEIQLYTAGFQENAIPSHLLISKDKKTLWFFTYGADPLRGLLYGLAKFDIASKRVTEYRTGFNPSIPHEPADLTYGPDGNIWFAESVYLQPGIGELQCGPSVGC